MPNDSPYAPPVQESRLDWERQFFDDDDEEHLASNMEQEPRVSIHTLFSRRLLSDWFILILQNSQVLIQFIIQFL